MQRQFVAIGLVLIVVVLLWPWADRLPLGRLPGDILIDRRGLRIYFPFTTMLLASALPSLLFWLIRR